MERIPLPVPPDYEALWRGLESIQALGVVFYGRSGTVFFQSLLDSHRQVITFPATVLTDYNDFWERHKGKKTEELCEAFCGTYLTIFNPAHEAVGCRLHELGPNRDENIVVDAAEFSRHAAGLLGGRKPDRRTLFIALHGAYTLCRREPLDSKTLLVHALHRPDQKEYIEEFFADFPSAKIVVIMRHPLQTLSSQYQHLVKRARIFSGDLGYEIDGKHYCPWSVYLQHLECLDTLAACCPREQIRAIRLEDLHFDSVNVLKKTAAWLGIEYNEVLLKSTFGGKLWWGDVTIQPVNGFAGHIATDKWKKDFNFFDALTLEYFLADRFAHYGYEMSNSGFGPFKKLMIAVSILFPTRLEWRVLRELFLPGRHLNLLKLAAAAADRARGALRRELKCQVMPGSAFALLAYAAYLYGFALLLRNMLLRQKLFLLRFFQMPRSRGASGFELLK